MNRRRLTKKKKEKRKKKKEKIVFDLVFALEKRNNQTPKNLVGTILVGILTIVKDGTGILFSQC